MDTEKKLIEQLEAGIPQRHQESGYFVNDDAATKRLLKKASTALRRLAAENDVHQEAFEYLAQRHRELGDALTAKDIEIGRLEQDRDNWRAKAECK